MLAGFVFVFEIEIECLRSIICTGSFSLPLAISTSLLCSTTVSICHVCIAYRHIIEHM